MKDLLASWASVSAAGTRALARRTTRCVERLGRQHLEGRRRPAEVPDRTLEHEIAL